MVGVWDAGVGMLAGDDKLLPVAKDLDLVASAFGVLKDGNHFREGSGGAEYKCPLGGVALACGDHAPVAEPIFDHLVARIGDVGIHNVNVSCRVGPCPQTSVKPEPSGHAVEVVGTFSAQPAKVGRLPSHGTTAPV